MSQNEINMILGEMRSGFSRVEHAIETSRAERQEQVADLHKRVSYLAENGCALRPVHEAQVDELQKQLHAERKLKHDRDERHEDVEIGTVSWAKKCATGIPAIIIAVAIAMAILGFTMVRVKHTTEQIAPKVEHTEKPQPMASNGR